MKHFLLIFVLVLCLASPVRASSMAETTRIKVNGMVCDFCAQALKKVFGREEGVRDITIDLDAGVVTVVTEPGHRIARGRLTQLVTDSGYNVENIRYDGE